MAYRNLYNLAYTKEISITGREELTENINLTPNPLSKSGNLSGTVTSKETGVKGATVKVFDVNDKPFEHTNTGENGHFTIANLPVGSYKVTAIKDGYILPLTIPISIQQDKTTTVNIDITLDSEAYRSVIYGIIRTNIGELPLTSATVSLYSNTSPEPTLLTNTTTNDQGQYIFGLVPPGEYYLTATKVGYFPNKTSNVKVDKNEFIASDISLFSDALANTGTISGVIKELSTGLPIADAGVALYSITDKVEKIVDVTRTNISGNYLFANVNPGTYLIKSTKQEEVK